ncbi:MAG: DUF4847 family protein [Bacteroidaceae bacterium]|nr:DUF4847 family protein [Bacteroidaceae bacterium]
MKIFINRLAHLIAILLLCISCSTEDDLDDLFVGKTWYMTGATINGNVMNSDIKNLYSSGESAYYIFFSTNTFQAVLSNNKSFSGTWTADGKEKTIQLTISKGASNMGSYDTNLYSIIKKITSYKGDANAMILMQDENNYIRFSTSR